MENKDLIKLRELINEFENISATFSSDNYNNGIDKENVIAGYCKLSDDIINIVRFVTATTINKVREL